MSHEHTSCSVNMWRDHWETWLCYTEWEKNLSIVQFFFRAKGSIVCAKTVFLSQLRHSMNYEHMDTFIKWGWAGWLGYLVLHGILNFIYFFYSGSLLELKARAWDFCSHSLCAVMDFRFWKSPPPHGVSSTLIIRVKWKLNALTPSTANLSHQLFASEILMSESPMRPGWV